MLLYNIGPAMIEVERLSVEQQHAISAADSLLAGNRPASRKRRVLIGP